MCICVYMYIYIFLVLSMNIKIKNFKCIFPFHAVEKLHRLRHVHKRKTMKTQIHLSEEHRKLAPII